MLKMIGCLSSHNSHCVDDNITIHTNISVDYTNIDFPQWHIEISSRKHGNRSTGKATTYFHLEPIENWISVGNIIPE